MKAIPLICITLAAGLLPAAALADDPRDPTMRNAADRARDREATRRLNAGELNRVRDLEARGMLGWRYAEGNGHAASGDAARSQTYRRAASDYARERAAYERQMADWRRAVAACRAGDYAACE